MTAVIYARYSSDNQREESIEGQIRECTAYAEKNGITVVKHYIDRALSAKTDNRPDFQQMIKDSEKRLFDIVLVWKLDRFARNRYDSAHYEYQLERNHVKLVSATEPISDSPAGIMVKSMLTGMAEYYSAELSEKVVRGMTENVLKGKYNGGTIPIGFKVDEEKFFQIDPLKAPFVVEAFQRYNDGATMKELMNWLNDNGVTTNRNQKFTYNSVQKLLTNKRYIGENRFKDIVMPDSIPAIVDKDLFEEVQLKIKKNSRAPARHKAEDDYLLTTKLFCGMCGAMMFGECGTGRNKVVHHYYKCATAKRFKTCKKKTVRKEWLEDLVVAETMKLIQDDAVIDAIVAEVMELQDQENTTLPLLEKQMREVENGIENMLNAIQAGVLTNSTKSRLEKLEAQQKELEIRIAEEKIARPRLSENQVRFWLTRFRKLDPNVKSHRETLINTFVNAVYLYDEKVLITFNYKDGTKTITFDEIAAKDAPEGNGSDLGCFAPPVKKPPENLRFQVAFAIRGDVVLSRQIWQDIRPQSLLLPQGIEAAVQIHFIDCGKNGAAQQQTLIIERSLRLGCLAAEHHRKTSLQFLAEDIVGCPGGAVLPLHFKQGVDIFDREYRFGDCNVHQGCDLVPGVFFADGVIHHPFFDVVAYHRWRQLHPAEAAEVAVDELHRLVQIQPYRGKIVVPGQGKARSTRRNAEFGFSFHNILFRSCSCAFLQAGTLFLCKGRAIAFRKSTSACEIVYRILENWSTGNENFVKEFEKTVDRVLKNCYDGHRQRNNRGFAPLENGEKYEKQNRCRFLCKCVRAPRCGFCLCVAEDPDRRAGVCGHRRGGRPRAGRDDAHL